MTRNTEYWLNYALQSGEIIWLHSSFSDCCKAAKNLNLDCEYSYFRIAEFNYIEFTAWKGENRAQVVIPGINL